MECSSPVIGSIRELGASWVLALVYAIAAVVETGKHVVALDGDSAFGFDGMEIETIC